MQWATPGYTWTSGCEKWVIFGSEVKVVTFRRLGQVFESLEVSKVIQKFYWNMHVCAVTSEHSIEHAHVRIMLTTIEHHSKEHLCKVH